LVPKLHIMSEEDYKECEDLDQLEEMKESWEEFTATLMHEKECQAEDINLN
jgi:cellobiose phosphorylase